jgi:hypothetical protein
MQARDGQRSESGVEIYGSSALEKSIENQALREIALSARICRLAGHE